MAPQTNGPPAPNDAVTLRPATPQDAPSIYAWLALSGVTPSMMGLPQFPDQPVPSWDEFQEDYRPYFFDHTQPESGRCFIIMRRGDDVGVVAHNEIDYDLMAVELDIWLRSLRDCGRGTGSTALRLLCDRLFSEIGLSTFLIRPSARNARAVAAYRKAGFQPVPSERSYWEHVFGPGDTGDAVAMLLRIQAELE